MDNKPKAVKDKIGQITEQEFIKLRRLKHKETAFKKLVDLPKNARYAVGDSCVIMENPELYGLYKSQHAGRDVFYLTVSVISEEMGFCWTLYPVG